MSGGMHTGRKAKRWICRQGFLFTFEMTPRHLKLKLLRIILLRRIRLRDMEYLRASSRKEMMEHMECFFLGDYWPALLSGASLLHAPLYMLKIRGGRRVFLRLTPRLHYMLRGAVGQHRCAAID